MKSHSLDFKIKESLIPIQILEMNNSYYIYVGDNGLNFNNLVLSYRLENQSFSSNLYQEIYSETAKIIGERLSSKFSKPIFMSVNISDSLFDLELRVGLEQGLKNYISSLSN